MRTFCACVTISKGHVRKKLEGVSEGMAAILQEWFQTQRLSLLAETAVFGAVLLVAVLALPVVWKGVRQYLAFRTVPADPEQHFLLGHAPRVSKAAEPRCMYFLLCYEVH